jgi:hypothetical protein
MNIDSMLDKLQYEDRVQIMRKEWISGKFKASQGNDLMLSLGLLHLVLTQLRWQFDNKS